MICASHLVVTTEFPDLEYTVSLNSDVFWPDIQEKI